MKYRKYISLWLNSVKLVTNYKNEKLILLLAGICMVFPAFHILD